MNLESDPSTGADIQSDSPSPRPSTSFKFLPPPTAKLPRRPEPDTCEDCLLCREITYLKVQLLDRDAQLKSKSGLELELQKVKADMKLLCLELDFLKQVHDGGTASFPTYSGLVVENSKLGKENGELKAQLDYHSKKEMEWLETQGKIEAEKEAIVNQQVLKTQAKNKALKRKLDKAVEEKEKYEEVIPELEVVMDNIEIHTDCGKPDWEPEIVCIRAEKEFRDAVMKLKCAVNELKGKRAKISTNEDDSEMFKRPK